MTVRATALTAVLLAAQFAGCFSWWDDFQNRRTGPGDAALDFVRGDRRVVVELRYVDGSAPNPTALQDFRTEVAALLGKDVEVRQAGGVPGKGASHRYTWAEIDDLEGEVRTMWTDDAQAVLFMLYLDGGSENDAADGSTRALGAAYHGTSVVMFKGNIRSASKADPSLVDLRNRPSEEKVERAVLVHEMGHTLGLVNHGLPMSRPHEQTTDPYPDTPRNEGEGHSSNKKSVMWWAVESTAVLDLFLLEADIPWRFDADDKADVAAARGG